MTAEEILVHAAWVVEQPDGWCQGDFVKIGRRGQRQVCLMGALYRASGRELTDVSPMSKPLRNAYLAVCAELGCKIGPVAWQDVRGRHALEVATLLRNAKRHLVTS